MAERRTVSDPEGLTLGGGPLRSAPAHDRGGGEAEDGRRSERPGPRAVRLRRCRGQGAPALDVRRDPGWHAEAVDASPENVAFRRVQELKAVRPRVVRARDDRDRL